MGNRLELRTIGFRNIGARQKSHPEFISGSKNQYGLIVDCDSYVSNEILKQVQNDRGRGQNDRGRVQDDKGHVTPNLHSTILVSCKKDNSLNHVPTIYLKAITIFVLAYLLNIPTIFANFGQSCSGLVQVPSDSYLQINTFYGYLINNIDMQTYVVDPCNPNDEVIKFCLKMPSTSAAKCTSTISMNVGDRKRLADISTNPDLGGHVLLQNVILTAVRINDNVCLTAPTSRGPLTVACKHTNVTAPPPPPPLPVCNNLGQSCYSGQSKSQSILNFTGVAVHCLMETLDKVFYQSSNCIGDDSIEATLLKPFPLFQEKLKIAVRAALMLYMVFFGIKVALNPQSLDLNSGFTFVIKAVLVIYFAVGYGPIYYVAGKPMTRSGILEHVLPTLSAITPEFAKIVFNSGGAQGLCEFDISKYESGYEFYAIWDAIDCRIGYYFGVALMYNDSDLVRGLGGTIYNPPGSNNVAINLGSPGNEGIKTLESPTAFRFFAVMFGFLIGGNIIAFAAGLAFGIVFISVILHFLSSYLVCLITLYTMAYISPIFIPMALFQRTKVYYDSWLKVTVSCALQPAVLAGFVALLLTMYDTAMYKNCQFRRHDYTMSVKNADLTTTDVKFSTFEIREPTSDADQCRNSAGYKLLKYYIGQGWEKINIILFPIYYIRDTFMLMIDLLYVIVFTVIFYFFSKSMSQFAADITNGPGMSAVTTGPTKVIDAIRSAGAFVANAAQSATSGKPPSSGSGGSGSRSRDTASVGKGGGSSDTASVGKGGGSSDTASIGKDSK